MSNQFNNQKKCRISGCSHIYELIPGYKDPGVCKQHSKKCQGVVSGQWERGENGVRFRWVKVQCDIAVPIDGGDFCEGCKDQAETYQQWKTREEAEGKQKFEKWCQVHNKAQSWWSTLSPQEREQECERLAEEIVKRGYTASGWAHTGSFWGIENGKFTSSSPNLVPIEIIQEFAEKEIGFRDSEMIEWISSQVVVKKNNGDNSPKVNNSTSSTQPPQSKKTEAEQEQTKLNALKDKLQNSSNPDEKKKLEQQAKETQDHLTDLKNDKKTLIIDLKNVKQISLREDGCLEIEFNVENGNRGVSISQVINDEQLNNNQELQKIKNYCQQNGKNSLNQQELNNILNSSSNNADFKPTNKDHSLAIGLSIMAVLIASLAVGLLLKRKKKLKRN